MTRARNRRKPQVGGFSSPFMWVCVLSALLTVLLAADSALAVITPAGSQVVNQSMAQYNSGPDQLSANSNLVTTVVLPVYSLVVNPPGSVASPAFFVQRFEGDTVYVTFSVANRGNAPDSVVLAGAALPPSTLNLAQVIFFSDANFNGRFDAGEDDPAFLAIAAGDSVAVSVAMILPTGQGAGDTYEEVRATSVNDPLAFAASVVRVGTLPPLGSNLQLGPYQNVLGLPGGEGSTDDATGQRVAYVDFNIVFRNDIVNLGGAPEVVQLEIADTTGWPAGISVEFEDTTGQRLPPSPSPGGGSLMGVLNANETRTFRTRIFTGGAPFSSMIADSLSLRIRAQSLVDTLVTNETSDHILVPAAADLASALRLNQTFTSNVTSFGDVVTLVVTVTNADDSVQIDGIVVTEDLQAVLNFLSSPQFSVSGSSITWNVGTLQPGQSRETVLKLVTNSRVTEGEARVAGRANGVAITGSAVSAGPVINVLQIQNDIFADRGMIFGDVFADDNVNQKRDPGEGGVGGVAIYLESGEVAVTDSLGKFAIPNVFSGYRVVRLDESTLPSSIEELRGREQRHRVERIVHLIPSGHATVSFPVNRKYVAPRTVSRSIVGQELVSMQARTRVIYQIPAIPSSYFPTGESYLKPGTLDLLAPIATFLFSHPDWSVLVEGHTDSIPIHTGDFPSNHELSVARASAVMRYLTAQGIPRQRIIVRGYGETQPVATNTTAEARASNRRVEIGFLPAGMSNEEASMERIRTVIDEIQTRPDSVDVRLAWDISTNSTDTFDVDVSVPLPTLMPVHHVSVRCGDEEIAAHSTSFTVREFTRSRGLRCEVWGLMAASDTAAIREITPILTFLRRGSADTTHASVTLRPLANGNATGKTQSIVLSAWDDIVAADPSEADSVGAAIAPPADSEQAASAPHGAGGIVTPLDGTLFTRQNEIVVRVRVPAGSRSALSVNGVVVPEKQIGQKAVHVAGQIEELTYFGVGLSQGWNSITLRADPVNGPAIADSVAVALSGQPRELRAEEKKVLVPANGIETREMRFSVLDQYQLPVIDGLVGTVVEGDTFLVNTDARPDLAGVQVTTRDGYFHLLLKSSRHTMKGRIRVALNELDAASDVAYVPPARPAFVSGILEAKLGFSEASGDADPLGLEEFEDGTTLGGEARLFAQGTTRGLNLTARMDTKKRYDDPLLQTTNPDNGYPLLGDASEVSYDAPAQGGNYVALEKGESFLRYGDFRSPFTQGEFLAYKRTTSGVTAALVSGLDAVRGFVAESDLTTVQDEIPGDGTSGFYYLQQSPVVENSITIVLQTRDRFRSERILDTQPMVQFRDYTVNYFNGAILFKAPVPVTDDRLNPIVIVANYETKGGEDKQYLYGFRGDVARSQRFRLGAQAVGRGDDLDYALYGVEGGVSAAGFGLSGEFARSDDLVSGVADAYKVTGSYQKAGTSASAYYRKVDQAFTNPSFAGGQTERFTEKAGFDARARLTDAIGLEAEGFHHRLEGTDETQTNVAAIGSIEKSGMSVGAGARSATEEAPTGDKRALLSIIGLGARRNGGELRAHWEHNLNDDVVQQYPDRITTLLSFPLRRNLKLVTSYEYRTAHGQPAAHEFLSGVEAHLRPGSVAYTKYSMTQTASDERMGAISGLKQNLALGDNLTGLLNMEGLVSFDGSANDEYMLFKGGLSRLHRGVSLIEGQYEYRWQTNVDRHLLSLIAARELSGGFAILFKDAVSVAFPDAQATAIHSEGRLAGAYRPEVSPVRTMLMVRSLYDRFSPIDPDAITWRLVFSSDVNVIPAPAHEIRFKVAAKRMMDESFGASETADSYLFLSQYVYRFGKAWDIDLWGRILGQGAVGTQQLGAGVELGRLFFNQVRVSAGYSVNGFEEKDLSENDAWAKGFGLRVQYILSDWIFDELGK